MGGREMGGGEMVGRGDGRGDGGKGRWGKGRGEIRGREGLLLNQANAVAFLGTFESSILDHTVWLIWLCRG